MSKTNHSIKDQEIFDQFMKLGTAICSHPGGLEAFLQQNPSFNIAFIQIIKQTQNNPSTLDAFNRLPVPDFITTESLKDSLSKHLDTATQCLGEDNNNTGQDS